MFSFIVLPSRICAAIVGQSMEAWYSWRCSIMAWMGINFLCIGIPDFIHNFWQAIMCQLKHFPSTFFLIIKSLSWSFLFLGVVAMLSSAWHGSYSSHLDSQGWYQCCHIVKWPNMPESQLCGVNAPVIGSMSYSILSVTAVSTFRRLL